MRPSTKRGFNAGSRMSMPTRPAMGAPVRVTLRAGGRRGAPVSAAISRAMPSTHALRAMFGLIFTSNTTSPM